MKDIEIEKGNAKGRGEGEKKKKKESKEGKRRGEGGREERNFIFIEIATVQNNRIFVNLFVPIRRRLG